MCKVYFLELLIWITAFDPLFEPSTEAFNPTCYFMLPGKDRPRDPLRFLLKPRFCEGDLVKGMWWRDVKSVRILQHCIILLYFVCFSLYFPLHRKNIVLSLLFRSSRFGQLFVPIVWVGWPLPMSGEPQAFRAELGERWKAVIMHKDT